MYIHALHAYSSGTSMHTKSLRAQRMLLMALPRDLNEN